MQSAAPMHETFDSELLVPDCLGVAVKSQALPFHSSARVELGLSFRLSAQSPTAAQAFTETHETPFSSSVLEPLGAGTAWRFHEVPFHDSASAKSPKLVLLPTEVQASEAVHDRPLSELNCWPEGFFC